MPSALETLVKILKLEREQNCANKAVMGGLTAFGANWQPQAMSQTRRPEHVVLVEELTDLLRGYDAYDNKGERLKLVNYMIERITGRAPIPPTYQARLQALKDAAPPPSAPTPSEAAPAPNPRPERPPRDKPPRPERTERRDPPERQPQARERGERQERPPRPAAGEASPELSSAAPNVAPQRPPRERQERTEQGERPATPRPEGKRRDKAARGVPPNTDPRSSERPEFSQLKPTDDDADDPAAANADDNDRRGRRRHESNRPPRGKEQERGNRGNPRQDSLPGFGGDWTDTSYDVDLRSAPPNEMDILPMPRLERPPRRPRPAVDLAEAKHTLHELDAAVTKVKGIGGTMAGYLENLDIRTVRNLLNHVPRRYDDYTRLAPIHRLQPETITTVIGKVTQTEVRVGKNARKDFFMVLEDGTGTLSVTFFGQHYLVRSIRRGMQVVLSGKVSIFRNSLQMMNPDWEQLETENLHTIGIIPVYRLTEGIAERSFRRAMKQALDTWADRIPDMIPQATLERAELADIGWAYKNLHFPEGYDHLEHARRRYIFDQLLTLQLAILGNRRDWQSQPAHPLDVTDGFLEAFIETAFPYPLTRAQRRAVEDIRRDVAKSIPMNRLIQGDVGSGKTAVAMTAMAMAVVNGKQAALMSPTSILAEQHYQNVERTLERMAYLPDGHRPVVALLTSALTNSEREAVYRGIADGSIDVVVGTHALIMPNVNFHDLAVAVIDEQHRFGVEQRGRLRGKGMNPHVVVMTATPIPRTLALTIYADLDLSIIDEKPAGRQPIQTRLLALYQRETAYRFIETQLEQGRQAFIVHPLVEDSPNLEVRSAMTAYEDLQKMFHRHRVCLLHGRMKPAEKDEVMSAFARHEYDVMVTTSVAEVGVDVPNASVIMIEGANRFGLAQLHQFRGRVGRGEHASFCLLMPDGEGEDSLERLRVLAETDDGFVLAERDFQLRGAGELLGTRQSGAMFMKMGEFVTPELVTLAQREARTIYEEDPALQQEQHTLLADAVKRVTTSEDGGEMT